MRVPIVRDGWWWILTPVVAGAALGGVFVCSGLWRLAVVCWALAVAGGAFMAFFFRDPARVPPAGEGNILAGADGLIRRVDRVREDRFLHTDTVRVSIFLSPFDVHVNRAPTGGRISQLEYRPGRHLLTLQNASSEVNEHSSILIQSDELSCLVRQIVGPIVRRVVYWLQRGQEVTPGEVIGMMKFGSRLDIYLPEAQVDVLVRKGDRVRAGTSVVARLREKA